MSIRTPDAYYGMSDLMPPPVRTLLAPAIWLKRGIGAVLFASRRKAPSASEIVKPGKPKSPPLLTCDASVRSSDASTA